MTSPFKIKIDPALIPNEPGCLSVLHGIERGEALQAWGNVPEKLKGAKWADVYSWTVFLWEDGRAWLCRKPLKTESPAPWCLPSLRMHFLQHNNMWEEIR